MVNTKSIISPLFKNHLQKAQEGLISAQDALAAERFLDWVKRLTASSPS